MKTVSKAFRDALSANTREEKLSGKVTLKNSAVITLTEDNIVAGSAGITSVLGGEDIEFGIVIVKEVRIGIYSDVDRYAFSGAKLNLNYALKVDGAFVEKTLGVFDITSAEREGKKVVLMGYSPLGRLNKEYDGVSVGGSPFEVIEYICKECGIEMAQTKNDFNDFINTNERIHLVPELNLSTYRDCLRAVLQLIGAFADSDENGKLVVKKFAKEPLLVIDKNHRYSSTISDYKVQYNALKIKATGEYVLSTDPDVELGLEMLIENAPMWKVGKKDLAKPRCDNLFGELKQIVYTPSSFIIPGDITLECGDMISLKMDADEEINTLIMAITWQYRGRMSVESTGRNPHFKGVKSGNTAIIHELQQQNANNKMVFYEFTNLKDITVGEQELETIGKITFTTVEETSAMFLAEGLINCNAPDVTKIVEKLEDVVVKNSAGAATIINDPSGNPYSFEVTVHHETLKRGYAKLEVYYYLNNNLIDYRPAEEMLSGQHILNLYYSFNKIKKDTVNTFEIKMKSTSGKITIPSKMFRASIAGQGLVATIAWDGQILVTDYVGYFDLIHDTYQLFPLQEKVTAHTQVPVPTMINEKVRMFDLGLALSFDISKIKETITAGTVVTKQTIVPEMLTGWTYTEGAVIISGNRIVVAGNAIPVPQTVTTIDYFMTHSSILGIETVIADISDDLLIGISFDGGATYKAYNGVAWNTLTEPNTGMTKEQITAISVNKWSEVATAGKYRFRFVFQSANSYFEKLVVDYANA